MHSKPIIALALVTVLVIAGYAVAADPRIVLGLAALTVIAIAATRPSWLKWIVCILALVPTASFLRAAAAETSAVQLAGAIESGSIENSLSATVLFSIGLYFVYRNRHSVRDVNLVRWLFLFLSLAYLSILWSQSAQLTLRRSTEALFIAVFALGVGGFYYGRRLRGHAELIRTICGVASLMVFAVLVSETLRGDLHIFDPAWRLGHLGIENQLGWMSAVGLILAWTTRKRADIWQSSWALRFSLAIPALGVLLTKSRETWVGVLAALLLVQLCERGSTAGKIKQIVAIGCVIGIFALTPARDLMWNRGSTEEDLETASGRTDLWQAALPLLNKHLVFGYGYGAFWTPRTVMQFSTEWSPTSLHNGYLETTAELGLAGLLLVALGIAVSIRNAWWLMKDPEHTETGLALIAVLVCFACTDVFGGILEVFNYFHVIAVLTLAFFISYRLYLLGGTPPKRRAVSILAEV